MPIPPLVRRLVEAKLDTFCDERIPPHARDEVRLEHAVRGNSVTLVERRPPWRGDGDWTSSPIAQLRYDASGAAWTLCRRDRNSRWRVYELAAPSSDLDALIAIIDRVEAGAFWG